MKLRILFSIALSLVVSNAAWAEQQQPLKIITETWAPFSYQEGDEVKGVITDVVRKVFHDIGVPVEFQVFPWKRAVNMLKKGQGDALYSASYKAQRATFLIYPKQPIYKVKYLFYAKKGSGFTFDGDVAQLSGKIGAIRGYAYTQAFWDTPQACDNHCYEIEEVNSLEQNFKKLLKGEIVAFPASQKVAEAMMKKEGYTADQFDVSTTALATKDYFLTFRKGTDPKLVDAFDQAIVRMHASGGINLSGQ